MARHPMYRRSNHHWSVWGSVSGGESRNFSVPSQITANLAHLAELRDADHEARRMARAPVLMKGA